MTAAARVRRSTGRRLIGKLLVASLRSCAGGQADEDLVRLAPLVDNVELARASEFHGVTSPVYLALRRRDALDVRHARDPLDDELSTRLAAAHRQMMQDRLRSRADLATVATLLDRASVPWVLLKGPVLSDFVYARKDLRGYIDLDVLVPPRHFEVALAALESAGLAVLDNDWLSARERRLGEVPLVAPLGTVVDLHWHLVNLGPVRDGFRIDIDELFGRARTLPIDGALVPALGREDLAAYVALHACLHGGNRLVWLQDLAQLAQHDTPAWHEVVRTVRRWRTGLATAAMFRAARHVLDAHIPEAVDRSIAPAGWRFLIDRVDRFSPIEASRGYGTVPTMLRRSAHGSPRAVAEDVARRCRRWVRRSGWRDRRAPPPALFDLRTPAVAAGTGRKEYLAMISAARS